MRISDTKGMDKYLQVQKRGDIKIKKMENTKKIKDVNISQAGKEIARRIGEAEQEGFSSRVEEIRASVLAGTYPVSSDDIADKIVEKIMTQKGRDR